MRELPAMRQRVGGDHTRNHRHVSDECRCAAQSTSALNALSLSAAWSDVSGGGIGSNYTTL
eukprot:4001052-Prymnesium_polylepis.1